MSNKADSADSPDAAQAPDRESSAALRAGLRQAGYHVMRAGYELLAGVSAFLEAVGGGDDDDSLPPRPQRIEVE